MTDPAERAFEQWWVECSRQPTVKNLCAVVWHAAWQAALREAITQTRSHQCTPCRCVDAIARKLEAGR